jgi:hypothetical protein
MTRTVQYSLLKKKKSRVESGTRQIGLNGYPLKQAGRGGKRVFLTGRCGAKPDPYRPIAIPIWYMLVLYFLEFSNYHF